MHIGTDMMFLLLALLSLSGLGICHKVADFHHCRAGAVSTTLFLTAALVLWTYTVLYEVMIRGTSLFPPFTVKAVLVAVLCGACAGVAILSFQTGVRYGRISTSWLVINLSTLVPALLSMLIYQEWKMGVKWQQVAGLILMMISMLLLWRDKVVELNASEKANPSGVNPLDHADMAGRRERIIESERAASAGQES